MIYFSKKFTSAEQNYRIHDKKLLIIVTVLKIWKIYAKKTLEFIILTNYKKILYFIITKKLNQRQIRWSKKFKQYKFTIRYTSDKKNGRTNSLNKQQNYKKKIKHSILKINNDELISVNVQKLKETLQIFKNDQKQFSITIKNWLYQKTKSMKLSKSITTNHCRIISIYSKQCNFYDSIADFTICGKKSRNTSKNVLIIRKTNTVFTKNMKKFNIKYCWTNHETKLQ